MEKIECDKCRGKGTIIVSPDDRWWTTARKPCPKCRGLKKLDWVEMIVGVDEERYRKSLEERLKNGTISMGPR
jgi:hypothetical protein